MMDQKTPTPHVLVPAAVNKVAEATGLPVHVTELNVNVGNSYVGNYNYDRNLQARFPKKLLRQAKVSPSHCLLHSSTLEHAQNIKRLK